MSKPQSTNGSESEFEFIETPKAPTPSFEKFEECGVRTTSVRPPLLSSSCSCAIRLGLAGRPRAEIPACAPCILHLTDSSTVPRHQERSLASRRRR